MHGRKMDDLGAWSDHVAAFYIFAKRSCGLRVCSSLDLKVYTPVETQFTHDAEAAGLTVISGYELFFWQGVHAWTYFADLPLDLERLRADLLRDAEV